MLDFTLKGFYCGLDTVSLETNVSSDVKGLMYSQVNINNDILDVLERVITLETKVMICEERNKELRILNEEQRRQNEEMRKTQQIRLQEIDEIKELLEREATTMKYIYNTMTVELFRLREEVAKLREDLKDSKSWT